MVAIVSGNSLGLSLSSLAVLGQRGVQGNAAHGSSGEGVFVNVSNGNLVLQTQDDFLAGRGPDAAVLRTYNSQGLLNDDNGDNWSSGFWARPLEVTGTLNQAGSTIRRTDRDGAVAVYTLQAGGIYRSTDGSGAHDTVKWVAGGLEWTDGNTGVVERYQDSGSYRLLHTRDTSSNAVIYDYNAAGLVTSVLQRDGSKTIYAYSGNNLTQIDTLDAANLTTTRVRYAYDTNNRLSTVTVDLSPGDNSVADGKVLRTTYTYLGTGKLVTGIAQSDGSSVSITYATDGSGRVIGVTNALGQTVTVQYSGAPGTAGSTIVRDALGVATIYDFDAKGQLTRITPPSVGGSSAVRQFAYNSDGDVSSTTDGEGNVTTFGYENGNQTFEKDAAGNTIERAYNGGNQLVRETRYAAPDPDGIGTAIASLPLTTRYVYDATSVDLLRFIVSAEGRVTEHQNDTFGQRTASITYLGGTFSLTSLAPATALSLDQLLTWKSTQSLSSIRRVNMEYDGRGLMQRRTTFENIDAGGNGIVDDSRSVETFVHDRAGRLLQIVVRTGSDIVFTAAATNFTYDGLGRELARTNALGQTTLTAYSASGITTSVTDPSGLITTTAFDAAGRLSAVVQSGPTGPALGETRYLRDADGRLRMTQDPTGVRTWVLYDDADRVAAEVDGNGSMTEYTYNRNDQVVLQVKYVNAVNLGLLVDSAGAPILTATAATVRPLTTTADVKEWRVYDAAQRLVRVAKSAGIGTAVAITDTLYDGASRVTATVGYAMMKEAAGLAPGTAPAPTSVSMFDRRVRHFHDGDGLLLGTLDAEGFLTTFAYDAAGRRTVRTGYANAVAEAQRGEALAALKISAGTSAGDTRSLFLYDGKGQLSAEIDAENYLTERVYDRNGNLTRTVRYATRVTVAVSETSKLADIRPAATPADRVTVREYDVLHRVKQETAADGLVTQYGYDSAGRLVSTTRAPGDGEIRTLTARFDIRGLLTGELTGEGSARLIAGQTQEQIDTIWAQYGLRHAYDAAGRRISTTDAAGARSFFYYNADGVRTHVVNGMGEVMEERYDALGQLVEQITYGGRLNTATYVGGLSNQWLLADIAAIANPAIDSRVTYTYTRAGKVASRADALGNVDGTTYNAFGDAITTSIATGGASLTQSHTVDRRGQRTSTTSDASGANILTSVVYDAFGRATRSVDGNGNLRVQEYDRLGRIVTTREPSSVLAGTVTAPVVVIASRTTTYDAVGRVLTHVDALGAKTSYVYDAIARTMLVTTPEGIRTTTMYTRHGQVQSVKVQEKAVAGVADGPGQVTKYSYDRNGNLVLTETALTATRASYDAANRLISTAHALTIAALTTDPNRMEVAYTYDASNRVLTRRLDPSGLNLVTSYQYDGKGQKIAVTDANGVVTTVAYDRKGQVLKEVVDPTGLNLQTTYTYDARGNTLSVTAPGGLLTQYTFDALGRRVQERVDPTQLNLTRSWSYDKNGNVQASTDPLGNVTRYVYSASDQLVYTVDPLGGVRQNDYDVEGRVIRTVAYTTFITAPAPAVTLTRAAVAALLVSVPAQDVVEHRVYRKDGKLTATADGAGGVVKYVYDDFGRVKTRTAYVTTVGAGWVPGTEPVVASKSNDDILHSIYDALNRLIYTVDGNRSVVALKYDANGNVTERVAHAAPLSVAVAITKPGIDAAVGGMTSAARDAVTRNTYDAAGRLTWTGNGTGAVTQRVYDRNGNVVQVIEYVRLVSGPTLSNVANDERDRKTSMAYDAANRLVFEVDALNGVTEHAYHSIGKPIRRTTYANAIASVPVLGTTATVGAIRAALLKDSVADRTYLYAYDSSGRSIAVFDPFGCGTETQYDAAGNAVATVQYATPYPSVNEIAMRSFWMAKALLQSVANVSIDRATWRTFDAAGRQVHEVCPEGAVKKVEYDGAGRLTRTTRYAAVLTTLPAVKTSAAITSVVVASAEYDRTDAFAYDGAGRLVQATDANLQTERFAYDGAGRKGQFTDKAGSVWTYEHDAAGRTTKETSPVVALSSRIVDATGNLAATAIASTNVVTLFSYDALGNLIERVEAQGRLEERRTRYEYDQAGRQTRVVHAAVGVYNATPGADALPTVGVDPVAVRVESTQASETRTFYDALGNAVANIDTAGSLTQKWYDRAGRLAYDVNALGFVTGYVRNAFGEVTSLIRYGGSTLLHTTVVTDATVLASKSQVDGVLAAPTFDHSLDRSYKTSYDRAGRVTEVVEPLAYVSELNDAGARVSGTIGKTTRNTYDAFGQVIQERSLRNAVDSWSVTTNYYNRAGRQVGTIDALGYLTRRYFNAYDGLTLVVESSAPVVSFTLTTYVPASAAADDHVITYTYDRLNRRTQETRHGVELSTAADGSRVLHNLTTTYGYDALGRQTKVIDAAGNATYAYYDALGRVRATTGAWVMGQAGAITPLTTYQHDGHGNVVSRIEHAVGAVSATDTGFVAGAASTNDRITYTGYDKLGRARHTTNAAGVDEFFSHDAAGRLTKSWQGVTGNDGILRTLFQVNTYDKAGQLTETKTPGSGAAFNGTAVVDVATPIVVQTTMAYNPFGEMVSKDTATGLHEYFDYDVAGRLWRTNSGDGADRIYLYDAQGHVTADARSLGPPYTTRNVKFLAKAQDVEGWVFAPRTDTRYDAMGRATSVVQPMRSEWLGGVLVQPQSVTALKSMVLNTGGGLDGSTPDSTTSTVALSWTSLANLGSGDLKVTLAYRTPRSMTLDGNLNPTGQYSGGDSRTVERFVAGDVNAAGATITWTDAEGVGDISGVVVRKKDVYGNWQVVVDQAPGAGGTALDIAAPADPSASVTLYLRTAGSTSETDWWAAPIVSFGRSYRFNATALGVGNYEYRARSTVDGQATRIFASGTLGLTKPSLVSIGVPLTYGDALQPYLGWPNPATGTAQALNYRVAGSTGSWSSLPVLTPTGAYSHVNTSALAVGAYEFELLWTSAGLTAPDAHATGTFTVRAAQPSVYVPASGLPPVSALGIYDEGAGPTLTWDHQGVTLARYRLLGGAWTPLTIQDAWTVGDYLTEPRLYQKASLASVSAGAYELELRVGEPAVAHATALFTVHPTSEGYTRTVYDTVNTNVAIISGYEPLYETQSGTPVWVDPAPYISGFDENGVAQWIDPPPDWHTPTYQVVVGQQPIYQRDENGRIQYETVTTLVAREEWVAGTAPLPDLSVTTPPYQAAHMTAPIPQTYSVSVTTGVNSSAISSAAGTHAAQVKVSDGMGVNLRPTVFQQFDRWSNLISASDPRSPNWKTTYRFNGLNQVVEQVQPVGDGTSAAGTAVTATFYDKLGRTMSVRDANGKVNQQEFDGAGNLITERHADDGVVAHRFNSFGDKVQTTSPDSKVVAFTYDKRGRLIKLDRGAASVYAMTRDGQRTGATTQQLTDEWTYDQAGRKLKHINGNKETIRYTYDLRGNLIQSQLPMGQALRAAYDAAGRKIAEVDAAGGVNTWTYNDMGLLSAHTDMGGATFQYTYDQARRLTTRSTAGQVISYRHDLAGQVTWIDDSAINKQTTYAYDLAGRRVRERTVQAGITYQDNHLAYDARGNLRDIADARVHIEMEYDKVGNRTRVLTMLGFQGLNGEQPYGTDHFFQYDAMNRQVVVNAVDATGRLEKTGHSITYDKNGNRKTDTYWGKRVVKTGPQETIQYDGESRMETAATPGAYQSVDGLITEEYEYDRQNRLRSVVRDGTQIDVRDYDAADRVVYSGAAVKLSNEYVALINQGAQPSDMNGHEHRGYQYDANGRMLHQYVLNPDGTRKTDISWQTGWALTTGNAAYDPDGYDAVGNARSYVVQDHGSGRLSEFTTTTARHEGYVTSRIDGISNKQSPGATLHAYDKNRYLVGIDDTTQNANDRTFVNDASGRALLVNQGGNVQRQLIVNGEVLGIYGVGPGANSSTSNPSFADIVDFDYGYSRISANYPSASPGAYLVRTGDTLQTIAQSAYGDSSLWYRIADANGLRSSTDLKAGQSVSIPNRVGTISNNSSTYKPYDPSRIEGDKTPNLPMAKGDGCGGAGQLLMVIVAVVVTVLTAGAAAPLLSGAAVSGTLAGTFAAGLSAITSGTLGFAGGFIAGAAGSIASQAVGMATGDVQKFSWKSVALSAFTGGFGAELGGPNSLLKGASAEMVVARAVVGNAATQGIAMAVGMQKRFDWRGVAASGIGAAVGQGMSDALGAQAFGGGPLGQLAARTVSGVAAGIAAGALKGGRGVVQRAAVDAFGNALGSSLAEGSNSVPATSGTGPWSDWDYVNSFDLQSDQAYEARRAQEWIGQSDAIQNRRLYELTAANAQDNFRATERAYTQELEIARQVNGLDLPSDYMFPSTAMSGADMARGDALLRSMSAGGIAGAPSARSASQLARERSSELTREMVRASEMAEANGVARPLSMREMAQRENERRAAELRANLAERIANGPQLSAWDPAPARAKAARDAALLNFLGGQNQMALGGVLSSGVMIGTGDVVSASQATDTLEPFDSLLAPMGGASRLGSSARVRGVRGSPSPMLPSEGNVGTYDELINAGTKGDNVTPHHIPSAKHMAQYGIAKGDGIAINMEMPSPGTGGRHRDTFTYGTGADVEMSSRDALAAGIRDVRSIYQRDGLYDAYIRQTLQDQVRRNKTAYPDIFKKP